MNAQADQENEARLSALPFFDFLEPALLDQLAAISHFVSCPPGHDVVAQGEPAVRVPSAGVFDDPERDAAEESPEVVASFFDFDSSEARTRERELREVYRQRRKDGRRGREVDNNW